MYPADCESEFSKYISAIHVGVLKWKDSHKVIFKKRKDNFSHCSASLLYEKPLKLCIYI